MEEYEVISDYLAEINESEEDYNCQQKESSDDEAEYYQELYEF